MASIFIVKLNRYQGRVEYVTTKSPNIKSVSPAEYITK